MTEVTSKNFGYLIAYVLPGFAVLVVLSEHSPLLQGWLAVSSADAPTVGGFFYITLASVSAGLFLNALRALALDRVFHLSGVRRPDWRFAELSQHLDAFEAVIENHFRYYQFFGNMALAMVLALLSPARLLSLAPDRPGIAIATGLAVLVLLLLAARDALRLHYERSEKILSQIE